jgi:acylphosphatase
MAPSSKKQSILVISGKVQGVCFRSGAEDEANRLGLTGYARNLPTGEVEVLLQGYEEHILLFIEWAKKGPPGARVADVEVEWAEPTQDYANFETY